MSRVFGAGDIDQEVRPWKSGGTMGRGRALDSYPDAPERRYKDNVRIADNTSRAWEFHVRLSHAVSAPNMRYATVA
jgi:hypothetical protein